MYIILESNSRFPLFVCFIKSCQPFSQLGLDTKLCCTDMLEVGLPGSKDLLLIEQQAHFALWAIIKSPLLIGADIR